MHIPTRLTTHALAYAACLSIVACGALEQTSADDGTAPQSQSPNTTVSTATTSSTDTNHYASPTNTNTTTNAGNANVVLSPNTSMGNTTGGGNVTDTNTTSTQLVCDTTWANYAQGFFTNHCANCHSHNHTSLTNYATVVGEAATLKTYISAKVMPVGTPLSAGDYNTILNWFACQTPQ